MSNPHGSRDRAVARVVLLVSFPIGVVSVCIGAIYNNLECSVFGFTVLVCSIFLYSKYVPLSEPKRECPDAKQVVDCI